MSIAVDILDEQLTRKRNQIAEIHEWIADKIEMLNNLNHSKQELEAECKDIELALQLLRKI